MLFLSIDFLLSSLYQCSQSHYFCIFRFGTAAMYGVVGGTVFVWATGWKVVMSNVPYIGAAYQDEEDS